MAAAVQVGLLGLGVVGTGVVQALAEKADYVAHRCGRPITIKKALVRDLAKPRRGAAVPLTSDPEEVLADPEIGVVVEVLGGEQPAFAYVRRALLAGKHVVTANKEMIAKRGEELLALAAERGLEVGFEASVGGGIPIIAALRRNLVANTVSSIRGIVNGTTNYILTEMDEKEREFADALQEAQALGYAEPDPTNDVEGFDARYKLAILCALAFGAWPRLEDIPCRGITGLAPADFRLARELGYAIRLLAVGRRSERGLEAAVQPMLVPSGSLLAGTRGVFNAIQLHGDLVGDMLFYGRGAGPAPTASAIVADLVGIVRGERSPGPVATGRLSVLPEAEFSGRFYLRVEPAGHGAGKAAVECLGSLGIGVAASGSERRGALALLSEPTRFGLLCRAAEEVASLPTVERVAAVLRVMD